MTSAQNSLYFREWNRARTVLRKTMTPTETDAQRHAIHVAALGFDKSSKDLGNAEFDEILKRFRAISQPGNARTQIALEAMPETRARTYIGHLLAALGEGEDYAETIVARMQSARRTASTGAGSMITFGTLPLVDLDKVKIALKKECRRRWKTKDGLLGEIHTVRLDNDFPEAPTAAAIMQALCTTTLRPLNDLYYEPLLVVLATLRRLATGQLALPRVEEEVLPASGVRKMVVPF